MAMAMALGLGLSSASPLPENGRVSSVRCLRRKRFHVKALRDDEVEITSIRDQILSSLTRRVFNWGREVHQQASDQMLKFFNELADGSLLISFGAPGATKTNADVKVPARRPSRYTKQFPYTAKRLKKSLPDVVPVNNVPVKRVPARVPSSFTKKSPIDKLSDRHARNEAEETELATRFFEDVHVEEEAVIPEKVHAIRPHTVFVRQSPIPRGAGRSRAVAAKSIELKPENGAVEEQGESSGPESGVSRPKAAFFRKSPIPSLTGGRRRRSNGSLVQAGTETSVGETVTGVGDVHVGEEQSVSSHDDVQLQRERERRRPATSFMRRSPVPSGSRKKRGPKTVDGEQTYPNSEALLQGGEVSKTRLPRPVTAFSRKSPIAQVKRKRRVPGMIAEEDKGVQVAEKAENRPKPKAVRPKASFIRKSPIVEGKPSRRKTKPSVTEQGSSECGLSEDKIVRIVLKAADAASQTKTREPAAVPELLDVKALHVEAVASSATSVTQVSNELDVETDVEFSEDESASNNNASLEELDLSLLTLQRLKRMAKSRGLKGYSKLRKAELVELLKRSL